MRHPALTRMFGVFLAIVSVVTMVAGYLGFRTADRDYAEQQRRDALLKSRILRAEELQEQLGDRQDAYDAAAAVYQDRETAHGKSSSALRMDLATYTATRAGIQLGQQQLDSTAALLEESMAALIRGYRLFLKGEEQFQQIYNIFLSIRGLLDKAYLIIENAEARAAEDPESEELTFTPDEIMQLAELTHDANAQLRGMLVELKDSTPADQRKVEHFVRQALEDYADAGSDPGSVNVELLAYGVAMALYENAQVAMDTGLVEGLSPEQAHALADQLCEEAFGLNFEELGVWLQQQEPTGDEGGSGSAISPEMTELLLGQIPDDRALIDMAIGLLDSSDQNITEDEKKFQANPHDMTAGELLLAGCKEGLDSVGNLIGLFEPTLQETLQTLKLTHAQLDEIWLQIHNAQLAVEDGYKELNRKSFEQLLQLRAMKATRRFLQKERVSLDELKRVIHDYESIQGHYRSVRAALLADDEIYARKQAGEDYLAAARSELALRLPAHRQENESRRVMCVLMAVSGLIGFFCCFGAFEIPRMRRLWIPLLLAVLPAVASEAISLQLGRGPLYSALFVILFGLAVIPLSRRKKGDQP